MGRLAATALALAALAGAGATPAPAATPPPAGPVSWVVGLEAGAPAAAVAHELRAAGARVERIRPLGALVVAGGDRAAVAAALEDAGGVDYVERRLERRLHGEPAQAIDPATGRAFDWAFDAVNAAGGLSAVGGGAPDVPVAVVDSGVDAGHPDLAGRVRPGRDVLGAGSVEDLVGHGTFVAALIAAADGNGAGGRGVAGATPVVPVRVSTGPGVTSADLAAGIVAAVDLGARVVNVSIGGPRLSQVERDALDYAAGRDVLVVASAGNGALDGNAPEYPAAALGGHEGGWSSGLSVAATDPLGRPAPFSTHGPTVSVAAPGAGAGPCTEGVYSAIPATAALWAGGPCDRTFEGPLHGRGRYAYGEGTSFSAPLVAGAAALVRQAEPGLRADQVAHVIRRSARPAAGGGWDERTGAGVLDVTAAVELARRYDLTAPALRFTAEESPGAVRVRAAADDASAPGRETAGGVALEVGWSRDGAAFAALPTGGAAPLDGRYEASPAQPLWFRATACDANRNCATRTAGPFTGAGPPTAAPPAPRPARPRARLLAVGATACGPRRAPCLRVAWRAGRAGEGRLRYRVEARRAGARAVVARAGGWAAAGRRRVTALRPRRALPCGRVVVRLTVRGPAGVAVATRRAVVRRACGAPPRGARARIHTPHSY
ncbi:S8 family peptidase [Miltoncostaea marina]|uniref:S8 family peptidase n=1 Tax=Miltoncostaea marina TaxID=2843215 RepID=UPI001C3E8337|nr:S8 family serine peptidase [Miltoncostaea marina]